MATITKQYLVISKLISKGASIEIRDRHGNTAMHIAASAGDLIALKSIIAPIVNQKLNIISEVDIGEFDEEECTSEVDVRRLNSFHQTPSIIKELLNSRNYEGKEFSIYFLFFNLNKQKTTHFA